MVSPWRHHPKVAPHYHWAICISASEQVTVAGSRTTPATLERHQASAVLLILTTVNSSQSAAFCGAVSSVPVHSKTETYLNQYKSFNVIRTRWLQNKNLLEEHLIRYSVLECLQIIFAPSSTTSPLAVPFLLFSFPIYIVNQSSSFLCFQFFNFFILNLAGFPHSPFTLPI